MENEQTNQAPDYFAQSHIASFINQWVIVQGGRVPDVNYGSRVTSSLKHYVARKKLNREDLDFELPQYEEALVKNPDTGQVYFHRKYLEYATSPTRNIDGLSVDCVSGFLLEKFVKVHLADTVTE